MSKVYLVYTNNVGYTLDEIKVTKIGDTEFIEGKHINPDSWTEDCPVKILMPSIRNIVEFKSLDDYLERANTKSGEDEYFPFDTMAVEIGSGLIPLVDAEKGGDFTDRIKGLRRKFAIDLGFIVPPVRIRDNAAFEKNEYVIKVKGNEKGKSNIRVGAYLALNPDNIQEPIEGEDTIEPAHGLAAKWIDKEEKEKAEKLGYKTIDATSVMATHLNQVIEENLHDILSRQDVQNMIESLKKRSSCLIDGIIPEKIPLAKIHRVFQNLLKEKISIRNLDDIFEILGDYADEDKTVEELTDILLERIK